MNKLIAGLFNNPEQEDTVIAKLQKYGFTDSLLRNEVDELLEGGMEEKEAKQYAQKIDAGKTLVTLWVNKDELPDVAQLFQENGASDLNAPELHVVAM
jgi:hypothetical protein